MNKEISIIIATVFSENRNNRILNITRECLHQLLGIDFEIIIVNNGPTELPLFNFKDFQNEVDSGIIKIINESKLGLSLARNIGISNAKGEFVFFLDDDITLGVNYFKFILDVLKTKRCLCVGGKVLVENTDVKKEYLDPFYYRFLSPPSFPSVLSQKTKPFYVVGASMAFTKSFFEQYGVFDERLGRRKGVLISGEETDLIMRIPDNLVYIEPKALILTKIDSSKLTPIYFLKRFFWQGVSDGVIISKHKIHNYYDENELYFRKGFLKILANHILNYDFKKLLCSWARYIGFKFYKIMIIIYS